MLKPLAKSVLIPIGLTASESETDAAIHEKMLITSNEEMNDVIEIVT